MRAVLYGLLISFLRVVTQVFFRRVEVSGAGFIPQTGPVVLVGNHPNSLLDPVMIATTAKRPVRMAAKEPLFRGPLKPILWVLGAVPVLRRQDQVAGSAEDAAPDPAATAAEAAPARVDNSEAFGALTEILQMGEAFAIFPEGISHTRPELAPLKTGAARIVLAAAAAGVPVRIVPCGLSYRQRERMRSRVLVQYGHPIAIDDAFVSAWADDPIRAAKSLTATITIALRALTINAPDFETLRVLDGVKTLYRPQGRTLSLAEDAELMRRFVDGWQRYQDLPVLRSFYNDVSTYLAELRALDMSDAELTSSFSWWDKSIRLARHVFFLAVLLPFAIPGIVLHAPVLLMAVAAAKTLVSRGDVRATMQMVTVTAATIATYAVAAGIAFAAQADPAAGVVAACATLLGLMLSGVATLKVLDGEGAARRGLWTLVALFHLDREIETLRTRRDGLRARLLEIVRTYIDQGLTRVVSDDEHGDEAFLDDDDADAIG